MNANEVIESYVEAVALKLPRKQRNDVAFELRALIREELEGQAEAGVRDVDAAMAVEFLRGFGSPAEVAARYRPKLTIIDPADGRAFLRATVIGLAVIWTLGLLARLQQPIESGAQLLGVIGQWWGGTVIASLWWPGVLVVGFGLSAWSRSRWPQTAAWKPLARDRIHGGRAILALGLAGIACGLFVLVEPRWLLDLFWGGKAAPVAYQALTYSEGFRQRQGIVLLGLLALNIPLLLAVMATGRWTALLRALERGLSLLLCAAMAWAVLGGAIFITAISDRTAKALMVLIIALVLFDLGLRLWRRVTPTPSVA